MSPGRSSPRANAVLMRSLICVCTGTGEPLSIANFMRNQPIWEWSVSLVRVVSKRGPAKRLGPNLAQHAIIFSAASWWEPLIRFRVMQLADRAKSDMLREFVGHEAAVAVMRPYWSGENQQHALEQWLAEKALPQAST